MASGASLDIPIHAISGIRPGPTLLLLGGLHGDEVASVYILRRFLERVDPAQLSGTLLVVPVVNLPAFEWTTRNTPHDMIDINRVLPGSPNGWLTEQIADRLSEVVRGVDCVVDYHSGPPGLSIHYTYVGVQEDPDLAARARALAAAHGLDLLYGGPFPVGSVAVFAASLGVPSIAAMVGGASQLAPALEEQIERGATNIMKHLGMLPGRPIVPERQWFIRDRVLIRTTVGGLFEPEIRTDGITKVYPRGTPLGRVFDASTLAEIERIETPYEQGALLMLRDLVSRVHPGDYAYLVAEMKTAELIANDLV